jgi:hypothetical protein
MALAQAMAAPLPAGWTGNGSAGQFNAADGVVGLPPTSGPYQWVVSNGGPDGGGALPLGAPGGESSGTTALSPFFSAQPGDEFRAWFTYLSSAPFPLSDYVWAALYTSGGVFDRYLFLAQGSSIPGAGMPAIGTGVSTAANAYVTEGVTPMFSPLGAHGCYDGQCGQSPWVETSYVFTVAGDFQVRFGASDIGLADYFPVGLAMALPAAGPGLAVPPGGADAVPVPEPTTLGLLGAGLIGLAALRKRRPR